MEKKIHSFWIFPLLVILLASCTSAKSTDLDKAAKAVENAKKDLDEANRQYAKEVASYRSSVETDLRENKLEIARLKSERLDAKEEALGDRNEKIALIQRTNDELDLRMRQYRGDNKENWKEFKREYANDLNEVDKSLKDLGKDHLK
ncbi:peptidase M23 [Fluviicola sp.]|uniref:peptidase M23 n=1 Tax=Fluviicola sp. TaxID=1917219 RepID=UPI003D2CC2C5